MFAPPTAVLYHLWDRAHRPTVAVAVAPHNAQPTPSGELAARERQKAHSIAKVLRLCETEFHVPTADRQSALPMVDSGSVVGGRFGLGTCRPTHAFEDRCGISFARKELVLISSDASTALEGEQACIADCQAERVLQASGFCFADSSMSAEHDVPPTTTQSSLGLFAQALQTRLCMVASAESENNVNAGTSRSGRATRQADPSHSALDALKEFLE